ncbi:MAG: NAD(P)/FAD-dependent oxidoreductase [Bacteroidetes bacterium]|nr:NAD(P)/FAD-dependent oxidoreductase [Bacteroidota bacterium]
MKTILILGAGTGGTVVSHALRRKAGGDVKIVLIDREKKHLFAPSLLWLMTGDRKADTISREINLFRKKGVEVVTGEIEKVDPGKKSVVVNGKNYSGDYLVISIGAELVKPSELKANGFNFYCLKGAELFRDVLMKFNGGKICILISSLPYKCPAAPYEAAMLIEYFLRKNGLRNKSEISIYSPEPFPLPVTGKENGEAVMKILLAKGIKYFPQHQWTRAGEHTIEFANGARAEFDLMGYVPVHKCPKVIQESGLTGKSGWVDVDKHTMEVLPAPSPSGEGWGGVYAIGDITGIPLPNGKFLPKAGVFAHYQAEVVAHNIAQKISGKGGVKKFNGEGQCFLETGDGKAGYATGNFYAAPDPVVLMKKPGTWSHWKKVWFEKYWFWKYF